jgi:uncharacterized membrane protein YcaP (DUF421 family)
MATILKAAVLYWVLLFILRVIPRRSGNVMTPFEFILLFLLGGIAVNAVGGEDHSVINALLAICTVALMHLLVATLKQHFPAFGKVVDGTPVVVMENGQWHAARMNALRVQEQDIMSAARQQGIERAEQIRLAMVERNGSVTVFPKK